MFQTLLSIAPLFILIALGRILYHLKIADITWVNIFNAFTLKIGFPALIFSAIYHSQKSILNYKNIFYFNSIFIISIFLLGLLFFSNLKDKRTYILCLIFNNIAFLGIPILQRLYGIHTTAETGIITSVYLFWVFTLGVIYLELSNDKKINMINLLKNLLKNPLLLAIILSVLLQILNKELPLVISDSIDLLAHSVTPIVLLSIGIFTGTISFKNSTQIQPVFYFTILTLVLSPTILYLVSLNTLINLELSIMEAAMPVAVAPFAMADSFKLNKEFIAQLIVFSTLCSAITLSLWHLLMI